MTNFFKTDSLFSNVVAFPNIQRQCLQYRDKGEAVLLMLDIGIINWLMEASKVPEEEHVSQVIGKVGEEGVWFGWQRVHGSCDCCTHQHLQHQQHVCNQCVLLALTLFYSDNNPWFWHKKGRDFLSFIRYHHTTNYLKVWRFSQSMKKGMNPDENSRKNIHWSVKREKGGEAKVWCRMDQNVVF